MIWYQLNQFFAELKKLEQISKQFSTNNFQLFSRFLDGIKESILYRFKQWEVIDLFSTLKSLSRLFL